MKNKLIRFALWLGIIEYVDEETDQQKLDRLMFNLASDDVWYEYMRLRWSLTLVDNQAAMDRLAAHLLRPVRDKEKDFAK